MTSYSQARSALLLRVAGKERALGRDINVANE